MDESGEYGAVISGRIEAVRREYFQYITENIDKIDSNLSVFYAQIFSAIESRFPDIRSDDHDRFLDDITYQIIRESSKSADPTYTEKAIEQALRFRKRKTGRRTIETFLGINKLRGGYFHDAIGFLEKYATKDAVVGVLVAYCYFRMIDEDRRVNPDAYNGPRPGEMELRSRQLLLELSRIQPKIGDHSFLRGSDAEWVNQIFWCMIHQAHTWLPSHRWFLRIALEKAKMEGSCVKSNEILTIAAEIYTDDLFFLRELFSFHLQNHKGQAAASTVLQMMQQYPNSVEPVYYGIKLAFLSRKRDMYLRFRKMAIVRGMPEYMLGLLDASQELFIGNRTEGLLCLRDLKSRYESLEYLITLLSYVGNNFFLDDEKAQRSAKKVYMDSLDGYCLGIIRRRDDGSQV
jgi:hypothetical protein